MKFFRETLELDVPEGVYYPEDDSLLMADVLKNMELKGEKCLEMGCGSGLLSITMAKKGAIVTACDANEEAIETTKKNAEKNKAKITSIQSNLFDKISGKFDIIVFNPPYLPVDDKYSDKSFDGGKTGRAVIERFLENAGNHLEKNGRILLLFSSLTGEREVLDFAEKCGFKPSVLKRQKIYWEELTVVDLKKDR